MDLLRLQEPFPAEDVEWRIQRAGKNKKGIWAIAVPYITNRAIMARLDGICEPANWRNEYAPGPIGGVLCGISVRVGDEWVTKWDGAENTGAEGMESGMAVKGGLSGAMKRAAVQWGIGRYLYQIPDAFARIHPDGVFRAKLPQKDGGEAFRWDPPALPSWALPGGSGEAPPIGGPRPMPNEDVASPTTTTPTCPKCDGPMWDNRQDKRNPNAPDFKCKKKECADNDGVYWPGEWPPESTASEEAAEKDRLLAGVEAMIRDLSGLNAERADKATAALKELLATENVTAEKLQRFGANALKALNEEKAEAEKAAEPAGVGAGEDDDDLPF